VAFATNYTANYAAMYAVCADVDCNNCGTRVMLHPPCQFTWDTTQTQFCEKCGNVTVAFNTDTTLFAATTVNFCPTPSAPYFCDATAPQYTTCSYGIQYTYFICGGNFCGSNPCTFTQALYNAPMSITPTPCSSRVTKDACISFADNQCDNPSSTCYWCKPNSSVPDTLGSCKSNLERTNSSCKSWEFKCNSRPFDPFATFGNTCDNSRLQDSCLEYCKPIPLQYTFGGSQCYNPVLCSSCKKRKGGGGGGGGGGGRGGGGSSTCCRSDVNAPKKLLL